MEKKNDIFGKRLRILRDKKDMNQEDIAIAIGISRASYSHYENNRVEPDMELIREIANYHKVDSDYLLGITDNPKSNNENEFDSLAEIKEIVEDLGIEDLFFHNINDWKNLSSESVEEIKNHMKYIFHKDKENRNN